MNKHLTRYVEIVGFSLLVFFTGYGLWMAGKGQEAFMDWLREDGLVENLTALFLLGWSAVGVYRSIGHYRLKAWKPMLTWSVIALLFFFGAGEEISWGQRIFEIETPRFFAEKNIQNEMNLHNLVIGGVKVNMLVFSKMLFGVLAIYLLLLRPLASKLSWVNRLLCDFQVPLARWTYVIIWLVFMGIVNMINLVKAGELYEFIFSVMFLVIFLNPLIILPKDRKLS